MHNIWDRTRGGRAEEFKKRVAYLLLTAWMNF